MDTRINAVIALLSSFSFYHVYAQQSRPNIIMILADDMGYSDIGCYGGEILTPNTMAGKDFMPAVKGKKKQLHDYIYWEHQGNRAVRWKDWKAVWDQDGKVWELYNIAEDRTECNNVAKDHKKILDRLTAKWDKWAEDTNVLIPFPGETY